MFLSKMMLQVPVVFSSSMERDYWERVCQMTLKALDHRPRSILVYINPFGGKGTAKSIYLKYVSFNNLRRDFG